MEKTGIINSLTPFGRYVKIKLIELGKTQNWLSRKTNISATTITYLIRGERKSLEKESIITEFLESQKI